VFGVIHLHPVAALLLGHVAGRIGCAHHVTQRERAVLQVHQPDADTGSEGTGLPGEMNVRNGLSQLVGNAHRMIRRAVLEEHAELVTPQRSEEHTSELQSRRDLVCRLLLEKKKKRTTGTVQIARCRRNSAYSLADRRRATTQDW